MSPYLHVSNGTVKEQLATIEDEGRMRRWRRHGGKLVGMPAERSLGLSRGSAKPFLLSVRLLPFPLLRVLPAEAFGLEGLQAFDCCRQVGLLRVYGSACPAPPIFRPTGRLLLYIRIRQTRGLNEEQ